MVLSGIEHTTEQRALHKHHKI